MRNLLMVVVLLIGINIILTVESRGQEPANAEYKFCGRIGATDQEAQEGYFAIDGQTMIVVKPGNERHNYFRARVGQRKCITITADTEPTS